jgi:MoxR-like ATPase
VQSALLEAMQERQVTIGGETQPLPQPFLVLATQNPIEQEGTYPLPEAQLDRFMLKVKVGYPSKQEEMEIIDRMTNPVHTIVRKVGTLETVMEARRLVSEIHLSDKIKKYIVDIVFSTRSPREYGLTELSDWIAFGASPRASIYMAQAAKAHAFLKKRAYVMPEDVKAVAPDVLRHRVLISYEAEAEEISIEEIIRKILVGIKVP